MSTKRHPQSHSLDEVIPGRAQVAICKPGRFAGTCKHCQWSFGENDHICTKQGLPQGVWLRKSELNIPQGKQHESCPGAVELRKMNEEELVATLNRVHKSAEGSIASMLLIK